MTRCLLVLCVAVWSAGQMQVQAACPSDAPGEFFCEDFDTYCQGGGYPGGTDCAPGATPNDALFHDVWLQTSKNGAAVCGTAGTLQTDTTYYVVSPPFGGKFPAAKTDVIPQHTFRDWVLSPGQPEPTLDMHRLIQNQFGAEYLAVAGLNESPLVLSFEVNSEYFGRIYYSAGFLELAYGDPYSNLNRANTDFVWGPQCLTYCNPYIGQGPFQIMCAVGNPEGGLPMPSECPINPIATAPLHNALAVGANAFVDPDPCHCGTQAHGGTNYHPVFFDGQLWWNLRHNSPAASSGTVTPLDGATLPPPADISQPGRFVFFHAPNNGSGQPVGLPHNWMTLTVYTNTVTIELTTVEISKVTPGAKYKVYSRMENIPRKYLGPFDTMRAGAGPGCELTGNSWTSCAASRDCLVNKGNSARFVGFDDISLSRGLGWTPYGGCCLPSGGCQDETLPETCQALGGVFQGAAKTCALSVCCPALYADSDHDSDVDASDFAVLQRCYTGNQTVIGQCSCFDKNMDNKIDQVDVEAFISCAAGPTIIMGAVPQECTR